MNKIITAVVVIFMCVIMSSVSFAQNKLLGSYYQNSADKTEPISWIEVYKEGGKALWVSEYALDCKQYKTSFEPETWETSLIRAWLNDEFLNTAFSAEEQQRILTSKLENPKNSKYDTDAGNNTEDRLFLLSEDEINKYFTASLQKCRPTPYAKSRGVWEDKDGCCYWWLRTPGRQQRYAVSVQGSHGLCLWGGYNSVNNNGVRPAMWVKTD